MVEAAEARASASSGLASAIDHRSGLTVCPHLVGENTHRYPMPLTSSDCQAFKLVNSDGWPRPTTAGAGGERPTRHPVPRQCGGQQPQPPLGRAHGRRILRDARQGAAARARGAGGSIRPGPPRGVWACVLNIFHSKSLLLLCGAFVWARRALNSQKMAVSGPGSSTRPRRAG